MKKKINLIHFVSLVLLTFSAQVVTASTAYISSSSLNRVLKTEYGEDAGVGTTSCLLCHQNEDGGDDTINFEFGTDFENAGGDGGLSDEELLNALIAMGSLDSDGDSLTNAQEFAQCSNPNSNTSTEATENCDIPVASGGDSGGCGMIQTPGAGLPPGGPGPLVLLMLMPVLLCLGLRSSGKKNVARA